MPIVYLTTNLINNRKYIGVDKNENKYYLGSGVAIKLAIKKYGSENFKKEVLEYNDSIEYIFEREKYWIEKYDAVNSKEFYNISEGGKGGDMLKNEDSIRRHIEGSKKGLATALKQKKGKTYEEIYGKEKASKEKEKRRIAGLGKKYSEERVKKVSEALKGKVPWNKGLKIDDPRVLKYSNVYILITPDNLELKFIGKLDFRNYLNDINDKKKGYKLK